MRKLIKIFIALLLIVLISVGSWYGYNKYYLHKDALNLSKSKNDKSQYEFDKVKSMKFLTNSEKSKFRKGDHNSFVKLSNKNNELSNFNEKYLMNPSVIKSYDKYEPELFDMKNWGENYLTPDAIKNDETQIATIIKDDLKKLMDDLKNKDINLQVNSAYRSYDKQAQVYENSPDIASVAGSSEHQSGLSIDFMQKDHEIFLYSPAYKWLLDNAYKYGFILSFPKDQQYNSGQNFEAWHWRYIGKDYANLYNDLNINNSMTLNRFIEEKFSKNYLTNENKKYDSIDELNNEYKISNLYIEKKGKEYKSIKSDEQLNSSLFVILNLLSKKDISSTKLSKDDLLTNENIKTDENITWENIQKYTFDQNYYSIVNYWINNNKDKLNIDKCSINSKVYFENSDSTCNVDSLKNISTNKFKNRNVYNIKEVLTSYISYSNSNLSAYIELKDHSKIIFNVKDVKNDVHNLLKYRIYILNIIELLNKQ